MTLVRTPRAPLFRGARLVVDVLVGLATLFPVGVLRADQVIQ